MDGLARSLMHRCWDVKELILHRAGELTAVRAPDQAHEAVRSPAFYCAPAAITTARQKSFGARRRRSSISNGSPGDY